MKLIMFKSKIHRAIVTDADLHYEGSVTISKDLMDAANILPYEQVHIWNVTNGNRLITYALVGKENSGIICINGAGAHLMNPQDIVIIATFAELSLCEAGSFKPTVVCVDKNNKAIS
jgi:aspartate 1-decarboxylase